MRFRVFLWCREGEESKEKETNGERGGRRWPRRRSLLNCGGAASPTYFLPFSPCGAVYGVVSTPAISNSREDKSKRTKNGRDEERSMERTNRATPRAELDLRRPCFSLAHSPSPFRPPSTPPPPHTHTPPPPPQDPLFAPNAVHGLSLAQNRDLTLERLLKYVRRGQFFSVRDYGRDPRRFMAGLESLALVDYSLCIKAGVHFTL